MTSFVIVIDMDHRAAPGVMIQGSVRLPFSFWEISQVFQAFTRTFGILG